MINEAFDYILDFSYPNYQNFDQLILFFQMYQMKQK